MIVVPANPNSIRVGMVRTGCLKTEFNSTYPTRLNGIINQNEFQESIGNINSKISSRKPQIFCLVISVLCIVGGLALVIIGATASSTVRKFQSILFGVGIGAIGLSAILYTIGSIVIRIRRTTRMKHAIAEESKKYSTRSPIACSWRLNATRIWAGGYRHHRRTLLIYQVIIDIRSTMASSGSARLHPNQFASRPTSTVRPQEDFFSPSYSGQSAAFCSQCGVPRSDLTANFCPSCGHPFNKY